MMIGADEKDNGSLNGKIAVITGAASGIGYAAALKMAHSGVKLFLIDCDQERLFEVQEHISKIGGVAQCFVLDITVGAEVERAFAEIREQVQHVDIVFSNAGVVGLLAPVETMPEEEWDRLMSVNFKGCFLTIKYAIPLMKQRGGSITVTSSIHGNRVFNSYGMSVYAGAKAGLTGFAKAAALELAKYKIRVNIVAPGAIGTRLNDNLRRTEELNEVIIPVEYPEGKYPYGIGSSEEVAELVVFLSSSKASYISGAEISIDGVRSLM